ncbi:hypothetical protein K402DRAFT_381998 [Aulographum hederae CBS 113979]|uniref:Fatty acid hydroxylase domain-containing protein n=1 Tax=Aulographum hederae CBS 113979 TaxID=1176131 RepID=A0A6G1GT67_9PEZI|nr:hypothetical protein K402DRAFT_381998 [Aulographum hederae CBS 113979]
MANFTSSAGDLPPLPPFTLTPQPSLISYLPDSHLSYISPIIAYWIISLLFHLIDVFDLFPQYRLHTPAEVLKRNHVSRYEVFKDVIIQQVIQSVVGWMLAMFEAEPMTGKQDHDIAAWARKIRLAQRLVPILLGLAGLDAIAMAKRMHWIFPTLSGALAGGQYPWLTQTIVTDGIASVAPAFASWELLVAKAIYWLAVPAFQFTFAVVWLDTWQYFLHRFMHMNKWMYTTFHSRHHRLYVPYAYGALYNHPFEGFLLDTLGAGTGYLASGMSPRQGIWFFTCSTIKTVDDHCGYALPWDPLQHLTSNNAGYHDIHHQSWGIKTNFSQPFFTFWDRILGTRWAGGDVSTRYERAATAAQKQLDVDQQNKANITSPPPIPARFPVTPTIASPLTGMPLLPSAPPGKASAQANASRQQVLDSLDHDGSAVLAQESAEEQREMAQQERKKGSSSQTATPLKGLREKIDGSLHGRGGGVLGVDSGH